jgi:hypothetical protein
MQRRKWIYIALVVASLILAIRFYTTPYMRIARAQRDAFDAMFKRYSNAIAARDYATAYSIGDQEFQKTLSESDFAAEQESLEAAWGRLESSSTESFKVDGQGEPMEWRAKLRELRRYQNGTLHLLYEFHFEDGRLQLFGFRLVD